MSEPDPPGPEAGGPGGPDGTGGADATGGPGATEVAGGPGWSVGQPDLAVTSGDRNEVAGEIATAESAAIGPAPGDEAPILPPAYHDGALQDAVGAAPPKESRRRRAREDFDDPAQRTPESDEPGAPRRRVRTTVIGAASLVVGLSIAALVFLGRANAERFLIACTTDHVTAEQGRSFPPWGSHPLAGPQWKPIALPGNAECRPRETDDVAELEHWYLDVLVERASIALTARDVLDVPAVRTDVVANGQAATVTVLDVAAEQLAQALLLARAPERRDQRKEVERLLGDVDYWRASQRLRDASAALLDAAKQFDAAAARRPRHATDAGAWASYLRKLADELHTGPNGAPVPTVIAAPAGESHPTAPAGVALPVEPTATDPTAAASPAPPDAGVPSGGVLL